jgi:hypothetical protein
MNTLKRARLLLNGLLAPMIFAGCLIPPPLNIAPASPSVAFEITVSLPTETVIPTETSEPVPTQTTEPVHTSTSTLLPLIFTETPTPKPLRFAVIGDYGTGGQPEADVAALIKSWSPDFVITTGDNNYPSGSAETLDTNVGQFYHEFIYPYTGQYGEGADTNRFFPSLGNHDWDSQSAQPYLDYFTLPENERYYEFTWGFLHFFALDSDSREPDGVGASSTQAGWLQGRLAASVEPWNIVYFHHAPYSSAIHGSTDWMQWPFGEWGANLVLAGHDHTYERIEREGITYLVNGLGGGSIYPFGIPVEGSLVRYNDDYGALMVEASPESLMVLFVDRNGETVDVFEIIGQ